jgi:uncharacterized iron-regulated membrane protein
MSHQYRTLWRWHFYAGLYCIPFILVLSITGTIYLFKPQYEAWVDHGVNHFIDTNDRKLPSDQVEKVISEVEGTFLSFELAPTETGASRIDIRTATGTTRAIVHPSTLAILETYDPKNRFMQVVKKIHSELMIGDLGSYLVELAACWTVVLIFSGLYLWWPRNHSGIAGVLYPRLRSSGKIFWRDLHSVIGIWVSVGVLLLIITGLPWASFWGDYFRWGRKQIGLVSIQQDWSTRSGNSHSEHGKNANDKMANPKAKPEFKYDLLELNTVVKSVATLNLDPPVVIQPPSKGEHEWSVKSNTPNRPKRESLIIAGTTGEILEREVFREKHWLDRVVGVGIALHEGQLFGIANQILATITTSGLVTLSLSGLVLWLRRRPQGVLGAPEKLTRSHVPISVALLGILLGIAMPLFGISVIVILFLESLVFSRVRSLSTWLGLKSSNER